VNQDSDRRPIAFVDLLCAFPRRAGCGSALLREVERKWRPEQIVLVCKADNSDALAFYAKCNFRPVAAEDEVVSFVREKLGACCVRGELLLRKCVSTETQWSRD